MDNSEQIFTGERFVPGIEDTQLELEHFQRYYSVLPLVKGKVVVDAACGEGYGSSILASVAKSVVGIDINEDAVQRAKDKYGTQLNLSYMVESIAELSLEDKSVDVLVSFETIEHVSEELQQQFLCQIARVLKDDGILIMSTPNKAIYSDLRNYHNEFHVKEFYKDEFLTFLYQKFENVLLYDQYFEVTSVIDLPTEKNGTVSYIREGTCNTQGKYYIALASNVPLPEVDISHIYMNKYPEYEGRISRILSLQDEVTERNQHLAKLDTEIENYRACIDDLKKEKVDFENTLLNQKKSEQDLREKYLDLRENYQDLSAKQRDLNDQYEKLQAECQEIRIKQQGQQEEYCSIQKQYQNLQNKYQQAEQENLRSRQELEQTVRNKEGHIELLLEVEREYEREKKSRTYRLATKFRKLSLMLLPVDSKRRFIVGMCAKLIRHPRFMLHVINPRRIKNFFVVYKTEGMAGVRHHYELVEQVENSRLNPFDANQFEVEQINTEVQKKITDYEKLTFTKYNNPDVSIVIPVYNQFEYTYNCLSSIMKNSGDVRYEIIIANDCSTDLTTKLGDVVKGIKIITNKTNLRFLLNCNNAAKSAKGKYIVFLNNDTQVQENWLQPLVDILEKDATVGMTGSKLVYSDGWLQEAGGIFWNDASAWNYGNRQNPDDPEFNYVKEADYISGASIMIRASLWKEIGGFDERFAPAYYEDSDLAFEVRKRGYKVVYQPLSVVIHFEGVSNGTDVTSGQKAYQVVNQQKFYEKWKEVLEKEHFPNAENVFLAKDRSRFKKHILVVDHYVPHYDKDAGGKCTYMYLLMFVKMGFKVTFIGDNFFKHEPYTTDLNQHGIEVLYGNYYYNNWEEWLKNNLHYFDYVYLQRPHISIKYIDLVKQYGHAKILYFAHDLHHIREYREYELTGDPEKLKSSEHWKKIEYELFTKTDVGHVVGSYEQGIMQKAFPDKPIRNIPLYIYDDILTDINKNFAERKDLIYVGGFGHAPNVDAVLWFGKEVFPKVLEKYPDMRWHVVGSKAPKEVEDLASENILIDGFLSDEDLHALYRVCRLAVVPLRVGAGVKGKVVEAAYYQIPLVTTSIGGEGLDTTVGNMILEDDADKMATAICELYEDYDRLKVMSDAGVEFISKYFTEEEAERVLREDMDI